MIGGINEPWKLDLFKPTISQMQVLECKIEFCTVRTEPLSSSCRLEEESSSNFFKRQSCSKCGNRGKFEVNQTGNVDPPIQAGAF